LAQWEWIKWFDYPVGCFLLESMIKFSPQIHKPTNLGNSDSVAIISNDGATILKEMKLKHPTAKMVLK
jgi:hypothetical protein